MAKKPPEHPKDLSDEQCMLAYQSGDSAAFEELYRRLSPRVYAFLSRRLQRREDIDEVLQLVFGKLHQTRSQYDPRHPVSQWVFVIAKTALLDHWRKVNREEARRRDITLQELEEVPSPGTAHEGAGLAFDPQAVLGGLKPEQREAVQLRFMEDLSYEEIASKLSRSQTHVRQIVSRAIRQLRRQK